VTLQFSLVQPETKLRSTGDGQPIDVSGSQESVEVSIWGYADEQNFGKRLKFPQQFYRGTTKLVLDFSASGSKVPLREMGIESLGTRGPAADVCSGIGLGLSTVNARQQGRDARRRVHRIYTDPAPTATRRSLAKNLGLIVRGSFKRKGVGNCWSVALWWSVSYPASGLACIDEVTLRNVS
jgi:hypothetical protein